MANVCTFEMRIKGRKDACYEMFNADFPSYDRGVAGEYGADDDFILCAFGECRYDVRSMNKGDETLREIAKRLGVELEIIGYDISEPEWIQHYHYKGDEVLYSFDLPPVVFDLEEMEIPAEDRDKYKFEEVPELYILKPEFMEEFEWDEYEETMNVSWRIAIPE